MDRTTVDIEFVMGGNLAEGAEKASQSVTKLRQDVERTSDTMEQKMVGSAKRTADSLKSVVAAASSLNSEVKSKGEGVADTTGKFNMLNTSVQQIVREMPSAAIGFNTFFLAISNNLPVLADSIKLARENNKEMQAMGKMTVPVWKQVISSIFSWQSAMMVGMTVLSMFGSRIMEWVSNLFRSKQAMEDHARTQREMNSAMMEGAKEAAGQKAKLDLLYKATQDNTKSMKERKSAVTELQQQYPAYFGNLKQEAVLAGQAAGAYRQLAADLVKAAMARAYEKRVEKTAERQAQLEIYKNANDNYFQKNRGRYREARTKYDRNRTDAVGIGAQMGGLSGTASSSYTVENTKDPLIDAYEKRVETQKSIIAEQERNNKMMQALQDKALSYNSERQKVDQKGDYRTGSRTSRKKKEDYTKDAEALARMDAEAQSKIEENRIALMEDGYEKERAVARQSYDKELARIADEEERRRELVATLRKNGVTVTGAQEAEIGNSAQKQRLQVLQLYQQEVDKINDKEITDDAEKSRKEQEELDRLMDKYLDYGARRLKIEQQYGEDVAKLRAKQTTGNAREINAAIVQAGKVKEEALREVTDQEMAEMKSSASVMVELFESSSEKSIGEIEKLMKKLEMLKAYMDAMERGDVDATGTATIRDKAGRTTKAITAKDIAALGVTPDQLKRLRESPEALKAFMEQWEKLRSVVSSNNPFRALKEAIDDLLGDDGTDKSAKEKKIRRLAGTAAAAAAEIGDFAGKLSSMFEAAGNQSLTDAMDGIQTVMNGVSGIAKGFAEGGIAGGVMATVSEGINLIGKAFSANARHRAALKQVMTDTIAQQREYNLLLMQEALAYEQGTTAFGTDNYGKASRAIGVLKKATEDLAAAQKKAGDIGIVTGHKKTGFLGMGHGKDTYSSILSVYPNLIKANGELNTSLAETILNNRKMSDEGKTALQNLINLAKEQKEAWKEVSDYLSSIFGEIGGTMTDALVDAFRNGTDAGRTFVDSVGKMLEKLGADMIYSAVLQKYFTRAQAEMDRITKDDHLDETAKFASYAKILDTLTADVARDSGKASDLLAQFRRAATEYGIDLYKPDGTSQTGRSGGLETLTQSQGTKLEGLMTGAQIHLASMDTQLENVSANLGRALDTLGRIEEHVSHCGKLDDIAETMEELKRNGIKVK